MIIKKYQAKTESEAIEAAKKELGDGIVVMNVKAVKRKGLRRFFMQPLVEVTIALEEETVRKAVVTPPKPQIQQPPQQQKEMSQPAEPDKKEHIIEERLDNLQSLLEKQLQKPENDSREKTEDKPQEEQNPSELTLFLKLLHQTMVDNEVEEKYARQIIDEIEKSAKPGYPFDVALANTYQKMILKFGQAECITPATKGPKVVFFIGPTGVGKTTTIAKIASKFCVEEKKKLALLTADTYRIAAAEQLRTYANILEVPFRIVYSAEEVCSFLKDFQDYDYVLVDTAGHSYQNEEQRENMNQFIASLDDSYEREVYLVLSATTKYRDLRNITDAYQSVSKYKLIFTKLDETSALGNLYNIKLDTGAALSYVTCGQNVPDDIEVFSPQKTVKLLLGGKA